MKSNLKVPAENAAVVREINFGSSSVADSGNGLNTNADENAAGTGSKTKKKKKKRKADGEDIPDESASVSGSDASAIPTKDPKSGNQDSVEGATDNEDQPRRGSGSKTLSESVDFRYRDAADATHASGNDGEDDEGTGPNFEAKNTDTGANLSAAEKARRAEEAKALNRSLQEVEDRLKTREQFSLTIMNVEVTQLIPAHRFTKNYPWLKVSYGGNYSWVADYVEGNGADPDVLNAARANSLDEPQDPFLKGESATWKNLRWTFNLERNERDRNDLVICICSKNIIIGRYVLTRTDFADIPDTKSGYFQVSGEMVNATKTVGNVSILFLKSKAERPRGAQAIRQQQEQLMATTTGIATAGAGATSGDGFQTAADNARSLLDGAVAPGTLRHAIMFNSKVFVKIVSAAVMDLKKVHFLDTNCPFVVVECGDWVGISDVVQNAGLAARWNSLNWKFAMTEEQGFELMIHSKTVLIGKLHVSLEDLVACKARANGIIEVIKHITNGKDITGKVKINLLVHVAQEDNSNTPAMAAGSVVTQEYGDSVHTSTAAMAAGGAGSPSGARGGLSVDVNTPLPSPDRLPLLAATSADVKNSGDMLLMKSFLKPPFVINVREVTVLDTVKMHIFQKNNLTVNIVCGSWGKATDEVRGAGTFAHWVGLGWKILVTDGAFFRVTVWSSGKVVGAASLRVQELLDMPTDYENNTEIFAKLLNDKKEITGKVKINCKYEVHLQQAISPMKNAPRGSPAGRSPAAAAAAGLPNASGGFGSGSPHQSRSVSWDANDVFSAGAAGGDGGMSPTKTTTLPMLEPGRTGAPTQHHQHQQQQQSSMGNADGELPENLYPREELELPVVAVVSTIAVYDMVSAHKLFRNSPQVKFVCDRKSAITEAQRGAGSVATWSNLNWMMKIRADSHVMVLINSGTANLGRVDIDPFQLIETPISDSGFTEVKTMVTKDGATTAKLLIRMVLRNVDGPGNTLGTLPSGRAIPAGVQGGRFDWNSTNNSIHNNSNNNNNSYHINNTNNNNHNNSYNSMLSATSRSGMADGPDLYSSQDLLRTGSFSPTNSRVNSRANSPRDHGFGQYQYQQQQQQQYHNNMRDQQWEQQQQANPHAVFGGGVPAIYNSSSFMPNASGTPYNSLYFQQHPVGQGSQVEDPAAHRPQSWPAPAFSDKLFEVQQHSMIFDPSVLNATNAHKLGLRFDLAVQEIDLIDLKPMHMLSRNCPVVSAACGKWLETSQALINAGETGYWTNLNWKVNFSGTAVLRMVVTSKKAAIGAINFTSEALLQSVVDDKGLRRVSGMLADDEGNKNGKIKVAYTMHVGTRAMPPEASKRYGSPQRGQDMNASVMSGQSNHSGQQHTGSPHSPGLRGVQSMPASAFANHLGRPPLSHQYGRSASSAMTGQHSAAQSNGLQSRPLSGMSTPQVQLSPRTAAQATAAALGFAHGTTGSGMAPSQQGRGLHASSAARQYAGGGYKGMSAMSALTAGERSAQPSAGAPPPGMHYDGHDELIDPRTLSRYLDFPMHITIVDISAVDLLQVHTFGRNQPFIRVNCDEFYNETTPFSGSGEVITFKSLQWTFNVHDKSVFKVLVCSRDKDIGAAVVDLVSLRTLPVDTQGNREVVMVLRNHKMNATGKVRLVLNAVNAEVHDEDQAAGGLYEIGENAFGNSQASITGMELLEQQQQGGHDVIASQPMPQRNAYGGSAAAALGVSADGSVRGTGASVVTNSGKKQFSSNASIGFFANTGMSVVGSTRAGGAAAGTTPGSGAGGNPVSGNSRKTLSGSAAATNNRNFDYFLLAQKAAAAKSADNFPGVMQVSLVGLAAIDMISVHTFADNCPKANVACGRFSDTTQVKEGAGKMANWEGLVFNFTMERNSMLRILLSSKESMIGTCNISRLDLLSGRKNQKGVYVYFDELETNAGKTAGKLKLMFSITDSRVPQSMA